MIKYIPYDRNVEYFKEITHTEYGQKNSININNLSRVLNEISKLNLKIKYSDDAIAVFKDRIYMIIDSTEDEWFKVYIYDPSSSIKYYICDQLDGLIRLIQDKMCPLEGIIKI